MKIVLIVYDLYFLGPDLQHGHDRVLRPHFRLRRSGQTLGPGHRKVHPEHRGAEQQVPDQHHGLRVDPGRGPAHQEQLSRPQPDLCDQLRRVGQQARKSVQGQEKMKASGNLFDSTNVIKKLAAIKLALRIQAL